MRFYATTPIYYVNSTPHIGHAYTTIAADILVRHRRQRGDETFFLTGTDEHGSNIPRVAEEAGLELNEFVDRNAAAFQEMTVRVNASNDFFVRTTDDRHKALVQEFLQRIYDRGDIFEGVYAGLYCTRCEAFYTEAELVDGLCPQHGIPPEYVEEKNYFFRLSAYQEPLLRLYDSALTSCSRPSGTTRRGASSSAVSMTSASAVHRSAGAFRCPGTRLRSSTCGWTPSSTTGARSASLARARTSGLVSGPRFGISLPRTSSSSTA